MKKLLTILFFFSYPAFCQETVDFGGAVTYFTTPVSNLIIKNAKIEGSPFTQIFDTTVRFVNCQAREFSTAWIGANKSNADNSVYLQMAIDICISNGISNLFVADSYSYSQSLTVSNVYKGKYTGVGLNIYGQGDMWNARTVLTYTGDQFAFGVQCAKGGSLRNLKIVGNYVPPVYKDSSYYQTDFPVRQGYDGIVIDYDGGKNTSGSSGYTIEDTWVDGFDVLYCISPNGHTYNADMLRLNHIRCGNARIGVQSNQHEEKGNQINYIASWDRLETLLEIGKSGKAQAGQYSINGGNIAGGCKRLFNIELAGWNGFNCNDLYAENLGSIGIINGHTSVYSPAAHLSNLTIRFALKSAAGNQVLFSSNSGRTKIENSSVWYYGGMNEVMDFEGNFCFENVDFGSSTWVNAGISTK